MSIGNKNSKKEQRKLVKNEKRYLEEHKEEARKWWSDITEIYYALRIDGDSSHYTTNGGMVKTCDKTMLEAKNIMKKERGQLRKLYYAYLFVSIISLIALIVAVNLNSIFIAFVTALTMLIAYVIIKVIESARNLGAKKYTKNKKDSLTKLEKALSLFSLAHGYNENNVVIFILCGFEKKRRKFVSLYSEQIIGIILTSLFLPGVSQLVDKQYNHIVETLFSLPLLTGWTFILENIVPILGITLYVFVYWLMTFAICILLQLPANIIINEITRILTTDELFSFFKDNKLDIFDKVKATKKSA